jgi:hypothetical protein
MNKKEFRLLDPKSRAWVIESEAFEYDQEDFDTAELADWPDELALFEVMANEDIDFEDRLQEWIAFVIENEIWLVLEQSSDQGILLPPEMMHIRLAACPENLLAPFHNLLRACPLHVLHQLVRTFFYAVRIDRVNRGSSADWRPADGPFDLPEDVDWLIKYTPRRYSN